MKPIEYSPSMKLRPGIDGDHVDGKILHMNDMKEAKQQHIILIGIFSDIHKKTISGTLLPSIKKAFR